MSTPTRLSVAEILAMESQDLGVGPWHTIGVPGMEADGADLILAGGVQPDPRSRSGRELDPLMILTIIPQLIDEILVVEDAAETVIVGLDQAEFRSSFEPGERVRLRAALDQAHESRDGHLLFKLGVAVETESGDFPVLLADVLFLAGNP